MLKRISMVALVLASLTLTVSCAGKKKPEPTAPVGGTEGGTMDPNISGTDNGSIFDKNGSDSGSIKGLSSVHFDYDSSTLSSEARRQLSENAEWIKSHSNVTVQIEGHCDARGSVEYNLALGERRAKAVKAYMSSLGIASKRMTIISYGEEKPIATGDSEDAYAKNRRANFVPIAQ